MLMLSGHYFASHRDLTNFPGEIPAPLLTGWGGEMRAGKGD